jgi:mannosyltransferase OCH1-like enzyme
MIKLYVLFFAFLIIMIIYSHHYTKKNYLNKIFPQNINFTIDDTIELPKINREYFIPKIIYRTHVDEKRLEPYQEVLDQTKDILPEYKTKIFFEEDILKYIKNNYSSRIFEAYKSISPGYGPAKADFFRYLVIYREGGIYLDIKSGPVKNIDGIVTDLKGRMAISNWTKFPIKYLPILYFDELYWSDFVNSSYGEYQNWYIIAGKGNPLLGKIIKQMVTNIEEGNKNKKLYSHGKTSVVCLTGPLMLSKTVEKHKNEEDFKYLNPNLNNHLKYKIIDHIQIEKSNHYKKSTNKCVLK